ncbi:MAG: aspartate kinase [Lentisphaerae bacterium]|nr:MAG: aspartate kinase [Lentisphaerota bacterium]
MHTVEKIGGTSMSAFEDVLNNIIFWNRQKTELYNRIFVVSAYGGITNLLLEDKKTQGPGVYAYFAKNNRQWREAIEDVRKRMHEINLGLVNLGLDVDQANAFVDERLDGIQNCLLSLENVCSYGHFNLGDFLLSVREMLSAVGEAHSAWNSVQILRQHGVNATFVDLTGWQDETQLSLDDMIRTHLEGMDFSTTMPIVTGYTKCREGIMRTYDRGYSEITFSRIAVLTEAKEAIIHKEYHLSSGDPKLIGVDKVRTIGYTNYDVADQLADLGMEAIHPRASKGLEYMNIPLRVKNVFEPEHPGTLITTSYRSETPRVEIICGRNDLIAIELVDPDMVGMPGYDYRLLKHFADYQINYIAKNTNANTITHYVSEKHAQWPDLVAKLKEVYGDSAISTTPVSVVCAIGSNMKVPGFLYKCARSLADNKINILAMDQCMRQVNMQFIIQREDFEKAIITLHRALIEEA